MNCGKDMDGIANFLSNASSKEMLEFIDSNGKCDADKFSSMESI